MLSSLRSIGLKEISAEEYRCLFDKFGGSLLMDPDFIGGINEILPVETRFFSLSVDDEPCFGIPTWGDYIAGERKSLKRTRISKYVDLGRPCILVPSHSDRDYEIKFKTNYLLNASNVKNAKIIKDRYLALFKGHDTEGISARYKKDLRRYWKIFFSNGGSVKNVEDMAPEEIAHIFRELHFKRWGYYPPANEFLELSFSALHKFMFGSVLFLDEKPVSIQIIYRSINTKYSAFEYVNSGLDREKSKNSMNLGILLLDLNTAKADEISKETKTDLVYSFGLYNVDYKERWCNKHQLFSTGLR